MKTMLNLSVDRAISNIRAIAEMLLVAALIIGGWAYNKKSDELNRSKQEYGFLEDGLKQEIRLKDGQIEILRRENGKAKVEYRYVPPEGSVIIKQRDLDDMRNKYADLLKKLSNATSPEERARLQAEIDRLLAQLKTPDTTIIVKDYGFTFKPGLGIEGGPEGLYPHLDFKWGYWRRWSIIAGGSSQGVGVGISRHLDDILWFRPKNIELFGQYNPLVFGRSMTMVFGLRSNF